MKKRFQKVTALAAMAVSVAAFPMSVSAAGVADVFDASYYADSYADLKEAFGYDETALLQHYLTWGLQEGRCASTVFDVAAYRSAYPDLDAAFGDNWNAYVDHYYTTGMAEGRTAGVLAGSASGTPAGGTTVEQPAPDGTVEQPAPGGIWTSGSDIAAGPCVIQGVYRMDDAPANVTITYDDVYRWEGDVPEGCEWQSSTITITTDGTPINRSILASYIGMDRSDPAIEITYNDWIDQGEADERYFTFDLTYNGKTYTDLPARFYYYCAEGSLNEFRVDVEAMVPKGYPFTTVFVLDADGDVWVRHQYK